MYGVTGQAVRREPAKEGGGGGWGVRCAGQLLRCLQIYAFKFGWEHPSYRSGGGGGMKFRQKNFVFQKGGEVCPARDQKALAVQHAPSVPCNDALPLFHWHIFLIPEAAWGCTRGSACGTLHFGICRVANFSLPDSFPSAIIIVARTWR